MAKQAVSVVERHVEKAVLGLAGLILLGTVVRYGIMQPNSTALGVGGETVTPSTVDDKVLEAAEKVKRALTSADPAPPKVEDAVPLFEKALDPLAYAGVPDRIPAIVPWLPPVPHVERLAPQEGKLLLAESVATGRPLVDLGRSTLSLLPSGIMGETGPGDHLDAAEAAAYDIPVNWTVVTATFDLDAQKLNQRRAGYGKQFQEVYLLGLEVQRREQRFDGTWSEDDWQTIETYRQYDLPQPPTVKPVSEGDRKVASPESLTEATDYSKIIFAPDKQLEIMRPLFPPIVNGKGWRPRTVQGIDLTRIDNELLYPDQPQVPTKNLGRYDDSDVDKKEEPKDLKQVVKEMFTDLDLAMKQRQWTEAEELMSQIRATPGLTDLDNKRLTDAEAKVAQEIKDELTRKIKIKEQPPTELTRRSPRQLLWAVDAAPSGLHGGHTYQYCVRARVYNRYFAQPTLLKNADDAKSIAVTGEWSEPSEPVYVPPESMFFLAGAVEKKEAAKLSLFQWTDGVWVDDSFEIGAGNRITGEHHEAVPDDEKVLVVFDTGATALDLDFKRLVHAPKSGKDAEFEAKPSETLSLIYVDAEGRLGERLLTLDKRDPEFKAINAQVYDEKEAKVKEKEKVPEKTPGGAKGGNKPPPKKGGGKRGK